jgi:glycine oxidase
VVGAGPWGLATAWRAAAEGARVTVIGDGAPPAAHVAAGMLGPWSEAEEGEEDLHALMVEALARWPAFAHALGEASGCDPGFRRTGAVLAASRPEHVPVVRRRLEVLERWGTPVGWRPGSALRDAEPGLGPAVAGGALLPDEHQAEPRALLAALEAAAAAAGVRQLACRVDAIRRDATLGVRLEGGETVTAGCVVIAAGWAAGRLAPGVAVRGVSGQILRLRGRTGAPIPLRMTVRTPSVYLAPRDGELVVGATMEEGADARATAAGVAGLLVEALRAVPEIAELDLAETAAGVRPATPDGRPVIGQDPAAPGLVWAVGGFRHGVLLTPLAAEAAAALAAGREAPSWARQLAPAPSRQLAHPMETACA